MTDALKGSATSAYISLRYLWSTTQNSSSFTMATPYAAIRDKVV